MSALYGIFRKDGGSVALESLEAMAGAMAHWRRHRDGRYRSGAVGVGHLAFHATPEARHERQPYEHSRVPGLVVAADARIDNRDELFDALGAGPSERVSFSDDRLILEAYERWGEACAQRLIGAFAFVVWDERRRTLFCARDHVGIRPFYYHDGAELFAFASDVKALLALDGVPQRTDEDALIAHYAHAYSYLAERTHFQDIAKLPGAHTLSVTPGGSRKQRYWSPGAAAPARGLDEPAYIGQLRAQLEVAVHCRLRAVEPVGTHLSGGLDSSAVTALASQRLRAEGRPLRHVFSWSPPFDRTAAVPDDERALIEALCRQEDLQCHYTELRPEDYKRYLQRDIRLEPTETLEHELTASESAVGHGIGVVLSGWGGDEGVSNKGVGCFAGLLSAGRWRELGRAWAAARRRGAGAGGLVLRTAEPFLPEVVAQALLERGRFFRDLDARIGGDAPDILRRGRQLLLEARAKGWPKVGVRRNQAARFAFGHLAYRMEAWAHHGASRGIDYRFPLLDRRLLDFAVSVPDTLYGQAGWSRYPMRRAMDDLLPREIAWNPSKREEAKLRAQARALTRGFDLYAAGQRGTMPEHRGAVAPYVLPLVGAVVDWIHRPLLDSAVPAKGDEPDA